MRRALTVAVAGMLAIGLVLGAAVALGPRSSPGVVERAGAPVSAKAERLSTASLPAAITGIQRHLRAQPRDAAGWATLGVAYVEQARLSADPTYYPKAEGVLDRSLRLAPSDNDAALSGLGALAAARHDFAAALRLADRALAIDPYGSRANAVRIDALVELGRYPEAMAAARHADAAQPGIPIFTRAAYLFELRGRTANAVRMLERAMDSATDPGGVAYVATHLGELAWNQGDLATAWRQFEAVLRVGVLRARRHLRRHPRPAARGADRDGRLRRGGVRGWAGVRLRAVAAQRPGCLQAVGPGARRQVAAALNEGEDRFGLSCWDALIVAAARAAGCEYLLTEDLQHGSDLDGLRVVSPFRAPPGSLD